MKPSPTADASVRGDYEASCDALLAGGHMGIHRTQIARILAGFV